VDWWFGLNGDQVNDKLERRLFGRYYIRELKAAPRFADLQAPSDATFANGVADSVTEQAHRVDAAWNAAQNRLTISATPAGPGYFIPYIGNGSPNLVGMAQTLKRGLGAYTPVVGAGGPVISWVLTGPFSGCSTVAFSPLAGGRVFAHVITPSTGYTADTVANQVANIAGQVGAPAPVAGAVQRVSGGLGEGYVFWTLYNGAWWRRVVWAWGDRVRAVDRRTLV